MDPACHRRQDHALAAGRGLRLALWAGGLVAGLETLPDESGRWLTAAAVQTVIEGTLRSLFPKVEELARGSEDDLVRETAEWALESL